MNSVKVCLHSKRANLIHDTETQSCNKLVEYFSSMRKTSCMKQVCMSKYLISIYYHNFQDYMFLIPSEADSNLKLYHISSTHSILLIYLKL